MGFSYPMPNGKLEETSGRRMGLKRQTWGMMICDLPTGVERDGDLSI
jgi:hypothetical protein